MKFSDKIIIKFRQILILNKYECFLGFDIMEICVLIKIFFFWLDKEKSKFNFIVVFIYNVEGNIFNLILF